MNQFMFDLDDDRTEPGFTMACNEQPQQRLENFGVGSVSDTELLALILQGSGTGAEQAVSMASRLIAEVGSIAGLISWVPADYRRMKGIGRSKGLQLAAIAEIARRMMTAPRTTAPMLNRPESISAHFAPIVAGLQIEKFWVLCLNRRHRLLKRVEITSGTAHAALAHPREVYRAAIRESASAIACVHNHPSGDPSPSPADVNVTRQLRDAAKAVDIELLDHVIVGRPESDPLGRGYYSFREAGIL
ncbi:MAG: DNA repair protein RadC [Phycisphaerales bacterium]|nr:DNA repair protein RadC [Phycisphaerales bacterium]